MHLQVFSAHLVKEMKKKKYSSVSKKNMLLKKNV